MLQRQTCHLQAVSKRFQPERVDYAKQYASLYWVRLQKHRPALIEVAMKKWPQHKVVDSLFDVKSQELCAVVGTLFMDMPRKPNVLEDLAADRSLVAPEIPNKYRSENDTIYLEDTSGRAQLTGEVLGSVPLVTGIVVAVLGKENGDGFFEVVDIAFTGFPDAKPAPTVQEDRYALIVSDLKLSDSLSVSADLLASFIEGSFGDTVLSAQVSCVILAGNSFDSSKKLENTSRNVQAFFTRLSSSIDVFVLPGVSDPVNIALPQRALHKSILTSSPKNTESIHCLTNPALFKLDVGHEILGTDGRNIADISRYMADEELTPVEMMEMTLKWRHMAPTAPDTLYCYPYQQSDPFVLEQMPHVYLAGNQLKYGKKILQDVTGGTCCLIAVPSFAKSSSAVMLNLKDLSSFEYEFIVSH